MTTPSQQYFPGASQFCATSSENAMQYQGLSQLCTPTSQNLVIAAQNYYVFVAQIFDISFKSNEKGLKNPTQVVADDTLHCAPNKHICVYLGQKLPIYDGINYPQVVAYLKYADDKDKNTPVAACSKHNGGKNGQSVMYSDDVGVTCFFDGTKSTYVLKWPYPSEDVPSVSICFACSSSCFHRSVFELHVDLVFPEVYIPRKHLVKVSANPGRDSGSHGQIGNEFARMKAAFVPTKRPRKTTQPSESESSPKAKRSIAPAGGDAEQETDLIGNGVFNITVYGLTAYKNLLSHYDLMITKDKYVLKKFAPQSGVLNSQIPPEGTLDVWLEKARMKKYKTLLNTNGIQSMRHLHSAYHSTYFENLGIPIQDAGYLHGSFIFWRTNYLMEVYKDVEPPKE